MTYISFADDVWWDEEKLDDEADKADMGGNNEVQPMPPPNVNVETYDQRYGSFQTRFGDYAADKPKSKADHEKKEESLPKQMVELSVWVVSLVLLILLIVVIRHYYLKKRRKRALKY